MRLLLFVAAALVLSIPTGDATSHADFVLEFSSDGQVGYTGPSGLGVQTSSQARERYDWNLTLAKPYTVGELRIHQAFDVERARQIVPEVDDEYFAELHSPDVWDVDGPGRVFNVTGTGGDYVYRLGFPGPGDSKLKLYRDVGPPNFTVGPVTELNHFRFLLTAQTDEYAFGNLIIRPVAGGAEVVNPTTTPALRQTFPIQGLDPDTEYQFYIRFWDWAGNLAESRTFNIRTLPKPLALEPQIFDLEPAPNSTVSADSVSVSVRYESPESPVLNDGVRVFFDKHEVVTGAVLVTNDTIRYHPTLPLSRGPHSVSIEVRNEAGGLAVARWSFEVVSQNAVPAPPTALALAVLLTYATAVRLGRRQD